ncbi:MAG TPA: VOC family protein, partial [Solirubrobacteraceae bacterium]|nr:VOC family protein [Solirubrobacteraceae bacterium]
GRAGAGMVHRILWRAGSAAAIDFWEERLNALETPTTRGEGGSLLFADPEGLGHELVVTSRHDEPLVAEHPDIPRDLALQGFEGVRAYSAAPHRSAPLLEQLLSATRKETDDDAWELRGDRRGSVIAYDPPPTEPARQSAGSVHHVAWGTTQADHPHWQQRLAEAGVPNSGVIDRHYFHSIYFREPSGVLFEIADDGPGFTVDVPLEELGSRVILPPRLERHRAEIEARLTPLPDPRAARVG